MDKSIAIEFENVGKQYRLGRIGTGTLQHDINRWWQTAILRKPDPYLMIGDTNDRTVKGNSDYVWALKDISFKVEQGDVVGIIGKNGAGKSTLLKLLSHITAPTLGNISYRGRIGSLLEVGTGFHPDLTAKENIYMNGSILGMTRAEINSKMDEIVEFAGIERYLDTPVKRFSSGMIVRLGFAVAAFLEPEILVVDEVLAVGDAEFQKKAIGKMKDVSQGQGRTVLFVSHNMAAVKNLCNNGIVLKNGMIDFTGKIDDCLNRYLIPENVSSDRKIKDCIKQTAHYISIDNITFNGSDESSTTIVSNQKTLDVEVSGILKEPALMDLMVRFKSNTGIVMATLEEGHTKGMLRKYEAGPFTIKKTIKLPEFMNKGELSIDINLHHPMVEYIMMATDCVKAEVEGSYLGYGRAQSVIESGFIELESI